MDKNRIGNLLIEKQEELDLKNKKIKDLENQIHQLNYFVIEVLRQNEDLQSRLMFCKIKNGEKEKEIADLILLLKIK